jgi:hypothetical protein
MNQAAFNNFARWHQQDLIDESDQRRLAAIVSADVACFSRLMGVDESGTR